jgi:hypothetical protein
MLVQTRRWRVAPERGAIFVRPNPRSCARSEVHFARRPLVTSRTYSKSPCERRRKKMG